jgi:cyclopropane fatty-acyl-phospholipid synthase-like methyltransferase
MIVLHQLKGFQNGVPNGVGPHADHDDDDDDDDDDDEDDVAAAKVATSASSMGIELPTALYSMCLGPAKKYSAGFWPDMSSTTLEESEIHMMQLCCVRAGVEDGMRIVDLQCGAGSLTLYIAEHYPSCHVTAICNKEAQRRAIMKSATTKNLTNIHVITVREFFCTPPSVY